MTLCWVSAHASNFRVDIGGLNDHFQKDERSVPNAVDDELALVLLQVDAHLGLVVKAVHEAVECLERILAVSIVVR